MSAFISYSKKQSNSYVSDSYTATYGALLFIIQLLPVLFHCLSNVEAMKEGKL